MNPIESLELPLLDKPTRKESRYIYYNNIAIFISTISFFYNIIEGAVSIYFGEVTDSLSLFFFGVQSLVEVLSSIIVLWKVMTSQAEDKNQIRKEKIATIFIGCLFIFLSIGIFITGIFSLINHDSPSTTIPNIIVSACASTIMLFLWITKKKLARELNSSTIQSDAQCSLACIRITILILLGSMIFHFWEEGWWIDSAIALILGILFGKEGVTMLVWANSKDFNGGCCGGCAKMPESSKPALSKVKCSTTLKNEYYSIENEDQDSAATQVTSGGCCKGGKCSTKDKKLQASSDVIISSALLSKDTENTNLNTNAILPRQNAAGGCCKGEVCSKKAQNQSSLPVEANPPVVQNTENRIEDSEEKPAPPKAAGGCCKGGSCKKKAEANQPAQVVIDILPVNDQNIETASNLKPESEPQPQKKAGGCCQGGKCSKKVDNLQTAPIQTNDFILTNKINVYQDLNLKDKISSATTLDPRVEVMPQNLILQQTEVEVTIPVQKPAGGCCKKGGCAKEKKVDDSNKNEEEISLKTQEENQPQEIMQRKDIC
jgi:hypothetical protein